MFQLKVLRLVATSHYQSLPVTIDRFISALLRLVQIIE